jgi:hypothetical protein
MFAATSTAHAAVSVVLGSPDPQVPYYPGETIHLTVLVTSNGGETDMEVSGALAFPPGALTRTAASQNTLPPPPFVWPNPPNFWVVDGLPCFSSPSQCWLFHQRVAFPASVTANVTSFPIASVEFTIDPGLTGPQVVEFTWVTTAPDGVDFFGVTNAPGYTITIVTDPPVPDADADRVIDPEDNCPWVSNPYQEDADADGVGDACEGFGFGSYLIFPGEGPQQTDSPRYRWKQYPDAAMGYAPPLPEEGGLCEIFAGIGGDVFLSFSSSASSGYACCAYDVCRSTGCWEGIEVFQWGSYLNAPTTNSDGDIFFDLCDNCPQVDNEAQRDYDGDERGNYCDSRPDDAYQCGDVDLDQCDDCSSGQFDPAADQSICLPVPEPAATSGIVACLVTLTLLGRRRSRAKSAALAA